MKIKTEDAMELGFARDNRKRRRQMRRNAQALFAAGGSIMTVAAKWNLEQARAV